LPHSIVSPSLHAHGRRPTTVRKAVDAAASVLRILRLRVPAAPISDSGSDVEPREQRSESCWCRGPALLPRARRVRPYTHSPADAAATVLRPAVAICSRGGEPEGEVAVCRGGAVGAGGSERGELRHGLGGGASVGWGRASS
ncbi:hypothetical protein BD311DRAFT_721956, partial [Dichomitus squalens]